MVLVISRFECYNKSCIDKNRIHDLNIIIV